MRNRGYIIFVILANGLLLALFTVKRRHLVSKLDDITVAANSLQLSNEIFRLDLRNASEANELSLQQLQEHYGKIKTITEFSRQKYIRIKGIPEKDGENLEDKIIELAEYMGVKMRLSDIDRANRIGARRRDQSRVIVAQLFSFKLKTQLLRKAASALRNSPFAIQDDVTNYIMPSGLGPKAKSKFTTGCGFIANISQPVTKAQAKKMFGSWLQDPLPSKDGIRDSYLWVLPHFFQNTIVEEYANVHELSHRRSRTTYELPYEWAGTGHVVFNSTLYFVKFNSTMMVRFEFSSRTVLVERNLPGALFGNNAPYQWSGSTDIDFSVDELGLWTIYATSDNALDIVLSKMDPISLDILETWKTNWRKQWSGNAFMFCGVLYVLKKYDEKDTSLSYTYDTRTGQYKRVNIPFTNRYEWNTMLEYNFRTKMLYAWDRGYLINYNFSISAQI